MICGSFHSKTLKKLEMKHRHKPYKHNQSFPTGKLDNSTLFVIKPVKLGTFHFNSHFKLFAEESYSPKMSKVPKAAPKVRPGKVKCYRGGGFKCVLFSSLPGEMIQFDDHIFQMGWFNHHLITTKKQRNFEGCKIFHRRTEDFKVARLFTKGICFL